MCKAIHSTQKHLPSSRACTGPAKPPTSLLRLNTLITVLANCPNLVSLTISCSLPFSEWLFPQFLLIFRNQQGSVIFVFLFKSMLKNRQKGKPTSRLWRDEKRYQPDWGKCSVTM